MKTNVFTSAVLIICVVLAGTACRSSKNTGGGQTTGKSYPVYRDPNPTNLPPGQAKKIYGDKSAKKYAPGQRKKYSYPLIIVRTPDIIITRHNDGRHFYRNSDGLYYWEGADGRFYIDEKHLQDVAHDKKQYDEWKNKGNNGNKSNGSQNSSNGNSKKPASNGNGNGKSKGKGHS